jgi:hypothetical protein
MTEFVEQYRVNWKEYIDRMSSNRIQKKEKEVSGGNDGQILFCNIHNRSQ